MYNRVTYFMVWWVPIDLLKYRHCGWSSNHFCPGTDSVYNLSIVKPDTKLENEDSEDLEKTCNSKICAAVRNVQE